jgi:hypothetical protein
VAVGLCHAKECLIQPRAIVEVTLVGLIDDCVRVRGRAEAQATRGHAVDRARLDSERDQVENPLLTGNRGNALGNPDSKGSRPN